MNRGLQLAPRYFMNVITLKRCKIVGNKKQPYVWTNLLSNHLGFFLKSIVFENQSESLISKYLLPDLDLKPKVKRMQRFLLKEVVRIYDCGKEKPSLENIYFNTLLLRIPFYFKIVHVLILPSLFKCPS